MRRTWTITYFDMLKDAFDMEDFWNHPETISNGTVVLITRDSPLKLRVPLKLPPIKKHPTSILH